VSMLKRLFSSQLRINMASGVVVTVINGAAMMLAYPLYLHFLGYEKYGVWLVLATVLSFAQLGNLGIGQAVMKLVAEEHGRDNIEGIQQYVTTALALLCLSGGLILIVVLVFKTQIVAAFKLSEENAQTALWLLPYIGILSVYVFIVQALNAALSGLGRMDLANYAQATGRIVAVTVAAVLLCSGRGIESLLIGNGIMYVFVHVVSLICIWRIARIRLLRIKNLDAQCCKRILRFGGAVFGGSVVSMLFSPFNKLMLSRYSGIAVIPVYEIAYNGAVQVRALLESALRPMMPEISSISGPINPTIGNRIRTLNRKGMKLILYCGIPLYGLLFLATKGLLEFWLQDKYNSSIPLAFRFMLIGTFINILGVPAYHTLLGLGKSSISIITSIIISGGNFFLVLTIAILFRHVSASSICGGVIFLYAISSIYLMKRASLEVKLTFGKHN